MVTKEKKEESVQVVVRVRPLSDTEKNAGKQPAIDSNHNPS